MCTFKRGSSHDDDYLVRAEIIHMLHTRLNQTSHPHTIHLLPPHEHLSTTLREIHVLPPSTHPVHTSFAWLGHGTMLHRSEAVAFLALLTRLNASEDEMRMADNYYTVLGNRVPEVWLDQGVELGGGQPFTVGGEGESRNARHILRATEYLKDVLRVQSSEMPFYTSVETGDVLPEHVTRAACRGISCLLETNIRLLPDGMVHASDDVSDILKQEETNLKTLGPDSISRYIGHPPSHAVDGDPSTFFESPFGATQGDYITLHVAEDLTMTQPDDDTFALALNMTWTVDADTERILPHVSVRTSHNGDDWFALARYVRAEVQGEHDIRRGLKTYASNQAQPSDVPIYHPDARTLAKSRIAEIDSKRSPVSPFLIDSFSRRHDYLRISLTEKCNLRCFYCMPEEGVELSPNGNIMTDDEVVRLATLFVRNGVTKIRLTGGEPTVRKGLVELVGMSAFLDTLDPFKFEIMTRRRGHDAVLKSIDTALASPELRSVKLNVVVIKGLNDTEVLDFLELTKHQDLSVRFIEFMPFTGNHWDKAKMLPSSELLARVTEKHPLVMKASDELNDTARSYTIPGYRGSFGFISSMSDHFCGSCNRLRLTADGQIKRDTSKLALHGPAASSIASGGAHSSAAGETQTRLTHIDETGRPAMVDVSLKAPTTRTATASGRIFIPKIAYDLMTLLPPSTEHPGATDGPDAKFQETYSPKLEEAKAKARSKGDVLTVAQLAAIMGCKRTSDLIPLCHPLPLTNISVRLFPEFHPLRTGRHASVEDQTSGNEAGAISGQANLEDCLQSGPSHYSVMCQATVSCEGKTGVEMEALTAVSVGLLTVWDMLKAVAGKEMVIGEIVVERKEGGKSGDFVRTHTRL
ncbi:hypothetical protein EUX98_g2215 [Antrodiella citrinella]|uniref:Radical SAM core domain-containing protein n=1 Tax=Antrodiella citrinella TaxID=2447956 RepID=A0A4S4MZI9_9APHY|nr:hypothetical protein EUX98_g2215 [Antrodiella citrinella]